MSSTRYSYTSTPRRRRTRDGVIVLCPRCGRRGAHKPLALPHHGTAVAIVTHGGRTEYGFRINDAHCYLTAAEDAQAEGKIA